MNFSEADAMVFLAKSWVTATLNEERFSWSEFLLRDPLGLKDH